MNLPYHPTLLKIGVKDLSRLHVTHASSRIGILQEVSLDRMA